MKRNALIQQAQRVTHGAVRHLGNIIVEEVSYSPAEGKYKVYIIDEVHMLSIGAFNALLKTLWS